jgi:dihydroorotate dehydrogenase
MYKSVIRPLLFLIDPERVHYLVFRMLRVFGSVPGIPSLMRGIFVFEHPMLRREVLGITFPNPVGLAAGFDKDAKLIDELGALGFGFVEIGTLTPKGQPGNDKPRLFRLPEDSALVNRMGFNNEGVVAAVERLKNRKSKIIVGGNIGKNKVTPNELAFDDYTFCLNALYEHVDYFVVNVSSPNTPGLRELQEKEPLRKLLKYVIELSKSKPKYKPVLLKIAPDLTEEQLLDIIEILKGTGTDGVIATNTTISRAGLKTPKATLEAIGNGGLSGAPLHARSVEVVRVLRKGLGEGYPIIAVGGIMNATQAVAMLKAGATLIQLYTGFIYEGPGLIKKINKALVKGEITDG